jgi:hypothetical protein
MTTENPAKKKLLAAKRALYRMLADPTTNEIEEEVLEAALDFVRQYPQLASAYDALLQQRNALVIRLEQVEGALDRHQGPTLSTAVARRLLNYVRSCSGWTPGQKLTSPRGRRRKVRP